MARTFVSGGWVVLGSFVVGGLFGLAACTDGQPPLPHVGLLPDRSSVDDVIAPAADVPVVIDAATMDAVEPPDAGCVIAPPQASAGVNGVRLWVIDQAEAQLAEHCQVGSPAVQVCRALWLAGALDPVELWQSTMSAADRQRAAMVVDGALERAAVVSGHDALSELRLASNRLVTAIDAGDEAVASVLIERNDPALIDRLRALERGCRDE